ncbi:Hypothetical protein NTJ_14851 [Nesidiocoris tenuis]|uniref:Uncharacterized protein n=1 Tax=Nesidiocoris tenuis TaxID=355587 RepID=A0ABN7BFY8_9HEMI|nr:Hypothetical protein NTJ_14851 [Nesidiocoris tenuis]
MPAAYLRACHKNSGRLLGTAFVRNRDRLTHWRLESREEAEKVEGATSKAGNIAWRQATQPPYTWQPQHLAPRDTNLPRNL